jgi:Inner membrane component of T3SS, cytoplasmic domain
MSRRMNIYYNAVLGAMGGLLGWVVLGALIQVESVDVYLRSAIQGAVVGFLVGALVGCVEGVLNGNRRQLLRGLQRGSILGLVGGAIGLTAGELALHVIGGGYAARSIGWALFGVLVGIGEGQANRSPRKASYGAVGGMAGGFIGGLLLEAIAQQGVTAQSATRGVGLVILGACIGSLLAVVSEIFVQARLLVLIGPKEGREYTLDRACTSVGSSDSCDVYLPGDPGIERVHAYIRRDRQGLMVKPASPTARIAVDGRPISPEGTPLPDGARLTIGRTILRVHVLHQKATVAHAAPA